MTIEQIKSRLEAIQERNKRLLAMGLLEPVVLTTEEGFQFGETKNDTSSTNGTKHNRERRQIMKR